MLGLLTGVAFACSDPEPYPPGEILLTQGQETDTWTADPVPVSVRVTRILEDGTRKRVATLDVPPVPFSMGQEGVARFEVTAPDEDGKTAVWGRSLTLDTLGLSGSTLYLFVGRTGRFSRPPNQAMIDHGEMAPAAVVGDRHIFLAGGTHNSYAVAEYYDLGLWGVVPTPIAFECPAQPCEFRSIAVVDGWLLVAVGDNWARWFDLGDATFTSYGEAELPSRLDSYSGVAGGRTVYAPDGTAYIVGATRTGPPTSEVLQVDVDGALSALSTTVARAGAAATWVDERGLVVVGGAAEECGAELLAEGSDAFVPLPFAPDPTTGAALAGVDKSTVMRLGGKTADGEAADSVTLALGCGTECQPEPFGEPIELDQATAFRLGDDDTLLIGTEPEGTTQAVRMRSDELEVIRPRDARRGATALLVPTGHVALAGGVDPDSDEPVPSFELLAP